LRESETTEIIDKNEIGEQESWFLILETLIKAIRKGLPAKEVISWTYDYDSLWSPRLRGPHGKINVWKCSKEAFVGTLRYRTYWYKRLPKPQRERIKILSGDSKGRRKIKDILDTTDGVLMSLIFSFPEMFEKEGGYTLSDRIANSCICDLLSHYSAYQKKLKRVRKTARHWMLSGNSTRIPHDDLRDMSFLVRPLQLFKLKAGTTAKSWIFRVAMFSQTRASGLAGQKLVNETVEDFIRKAQEPTEFNPNDLLLSCIDQVTSHLAQELRPGTNSQFRISMSTSACRESPRRKEGKFGYLKELVRDAEVEIPPLLAGTPGTLGNWLWPESILKIDRGDSEVFKTNVAAVRENSKSRVVTSGSFWKEIALQPFSHITIQLIKNISNLRNGLQAGRLGWRFIMSVNPHDERTSWIFDRRTKKYLYTSDWAMATDGPSPLMGRAVTGQLLRKTGLPEPILESTLKVWLGRKEMYHRGKFVGYLLRGIPMGDPLTKTNLCLSHPICDLYARSKTGARSVEEGNGDDTAAITDHEEYGKYHLEAAKMLGYEASELDDVTSSCWGVYAEEWFHVPVSTINTCRVGSKMKRPALMPYLDTPKLRIMVATSKDREDFSSDPRGKVTLMGHDEEYIPLKDQGPLRTIFSIASAFQDISLATIDRPEPLFLPRQVNGVGKPPPFWSVTSWLNILKNCPSWHRKYYLTAMNEINTGKYGISGYKGALRESQHFDKEMMVELYTIPKTDPVKAYVVVSEEDWDYYGDLALHKLVTLGHLVPESKIIKYYLFQQRLTSLEQDLKSDLFEVIKAKMVKYPDIGDEHARTIVGEFSSTYRETPYRLKSRKREPLYRSEVLGVLENASPLAVHNSNYPLVQKFVKREKPENLYEIQGLELLYWFEANYNLKSNGQRPTPPPTNILEDDPVIIQAIGNGGADLHVIVTDDMKLFRLARNKFHDTKIVRMSVLHYLQSRLFLTEEGIIGEERPRWRIPGMEDDDLLDNDLDQEIELDYETQLQDSYRALYGRWIEIKVHLDRGNIEGFENQYNEDDTGFFYKTEGIPWTSEISNTNLKRIPYTERNWGYVARSFASLSIPRELGEEWMHQMLVSEAAERQAQQARRPIGRLTRGKRVIRR